VHAAIVAALLERRRGHETVLAEAFVLQRPVDVHGLVLLGPLPAEGEGRAAAEFERLVDVGGAVAEEVVAAGGFECDVEPAVAPDRASVAAGVNPSARVTITKPTG